MGIFRNDYLGNKNAKKDKSSISNHHLVDCGVFVDDLNTRVGLVCRLILKGYYMMNCHNLAQMWRHVSMNEIVYIHDGEICLGGVREVDDIVKIMRHYETPDEEIKQYIENRDEWQKKKYVEDCGMNGECLSKNRYKPFINCYDDVKLFERCSHLRDDDFITDVDERKRLGIYEWDRLFIHNTTKSMYIFSNMKDYTYEKEVSHQPKEGYFFRLANLDDVLETRKGWKREYTID